MTIPINETGKAIQAGAVNLARIKADVAEFVKTSNESIEKVDAFLNEVEAKATTTTAFGQSASQNTSNAGGASAYHGVDFSNLGKGVSEAVNKEIDKAQKEIEQSEKQGAKRRVITKAEELVVQKRQEIKNIKEKLKNESSLSKSQPRQEVARDIVALIVSCRGLLGQLSETQDKNSLRGKLLMAEAKLKGAKNKKVQAEFNLLADVFSPPVDELLGQVADFLPPANVV